MTIVSIYYLLLLMCPICPVQRYLIITLRGFFSNCLQFFLYKSTAASHNSSTGIKEVSVKFLIFDKKKIKSIFLFINSRRVFLGSLTKNIG